jgi:predicted 3-demethylubiquinone-9 3-methyltransferase (glyoxalase superfamily)
MSKITPCLWFDADGEDAAESCSSVFPSSRIVEVTRSRSAGHGQ